MPKLLLFIIIVIALTGCEDPMAINYPVPSKNEINNVLKTVIDQQRMVIQIDTTGRIINGADSIFKYNTLDSLLLTVNLVKLTIGFDRTSREHDITFDNLLDTTRPYHFKSTDKSYLYFQNRILKGIKIDKSAAPRSRFTNDKWLHDEFHEKHNVHPFYNLSIPLFSQDRLKAYVQIEAYFGFNSAEAYGITLEKIKGKWQIVWQDIVWRT